MALSFKEFKPSSWAIDNKTTTYILTIIITLGGMLSYIGLPKEQFPEVIFPQILVNTVYPGNTPADMENLVTKQIEKQLKAISGVKKITSKSIQDFSMINVEFNTDVNVADAKQKVKDAVDRARSDLPNDLPQDPVVMDIDISQMPIMNVHVSGDYDLTRLKNYAEDLQDRIEALKEITRVDLVGALDREIQVNVDLYKMQAAGISMGDVEAAIAYENMTISGGLLDMGNVKRSINVRGEFQDILSIQNIVVRGGSGAVVYLKDIADVTDSFKEKESYARLDGKNVITLNVIKRSGENLIEASDKISDLIHEMERTKFPKGLTIKITGDQSSQTRVTLHDLMNTIIIGFILVTLILMFFMGTANAIFVGLSVPISMCIAFLLMPFIGFTLNMVVLFAFLLALGIVVDDAIVVIENTHRIFHDEKLPITVAAKKATGEVFLPVLSGTLTTLGPFVPLAFWQGIIGKFMFYMPITMIVTLMASLFVAYIINPVFAVDFMKDRDDEYVPAKADRRFLIVTVVMAAFSLLAYLGGNFGLGNFLVFLYLLYVADRFILEGIIHKFQTVVWPGIQHLYQRSLAWFLHKWRALALLVSTIVLFFLSIVLTALFNPGVVFFPQADPNFIYTYITLPVGTDQTYTDSVTYTIEKRIRAVLGDNNPVVESVISNVAVGASDPQSFDMSTSPHLGKVTVAFVEFSKRNGVSTTDYLDKIRDAVKGIPGATIAVEKENNGPPTGKPINIEIVGDDFEELITTARGLQFYLDSLQIAGVEELKSDLQLNKPELTVRIDRERANREGISTAQIGMALRTSVFGKEVSKFRDANDDYPIMLRLKPEQRGNADLLLNQQMIYRDMNMGGIIRQVPISSLASLSYGSSYGGITRKNLKRMVTLSSNVLGGYNPQEVVGNVQKAITGYQTPSNIQISFTGEQEDQKETTGFLGRAMLASILIIVLILFAQFNSVSRVLIILSEILFSIIGVLLGFVMFQMEFSSIMVGIGIVALAGIVVRNGILIVEFMDIKLKEGASIRDSILEAGKTRMTPVLLTASATMLGLVPLAVGLNIDFVKLFTELNPHIFFGGDSVAFWGPLSWTMIFGLGFATFLTLVLVPAMMFLALKLKKKLFPSSGLI